MADTDKFIDMDILALTAWGEARSMGAQGMQATLNTVQNRLKSGALWWGSTLRDICLYPWQYSCWNKNDPNRPKLISVDETDKLFGIASDLAQKTILGSLEDITHFADSYFDQRITHPKWSEGLNPCFKLFPHLYFRTV